MTEVIAKNLKEDEIQLIKVTDDDGEELEFQLLEIVTVNGNDYALLTLPESEHCCEEDDCECDDDIVLMKVVRENDDFTLMTIEDDKEFDEVVKILEDDYSDSDNEQEDK